MVVFISCQLSLLTCQSIIFTVKPLQVKIINKLNESGLILGQRQTIECHVFGSKPAPRVRWFMGSRELTTGEEEANNKDKARESPSSQNNHHIISELNRDTNSSKISYLTLEPRLSDNQESLSCSAENPRMASRQLPLSDSIVMNVLCK